MGTPCATRRQLLLAVLGGAASARVAVPAAASPAAGPPLRFPRDHGSHPQQHIEWWYITGQALSGSGAQARAFGFQITFFRTRVDGTQAMRSRFAARQLLFAHAAVTDVQQRRFLHDQRIARAGFDIASASETDTALRLRDWSLVRSAGVYQARIRGEEFALELAFTPTQEVLLQGERGRSRKGPDARQFSMYYSVPQLAFEGAITLQGQRFPVAGDGARQAGPAFVPPRGAAWLDHEWSDSLLHPDAVGWDWIGINLFDGSALTAFRLRDRAGQALWDGGSFRAAGQASAVGPNIFNRGETLFQAVRRWKSPLTQADYPVEWLLRTPSGSYRVRAVMDNQELDSRNSTGAVYWEGLCELTDDNQRPVGRGYLEMTGYAKPLVL